MGERLVPEKQVLRARKERQMWQKRFMKCQEEVARGKVDVEQLRAVVEEKELLLKKAIAQKGVTRTAEMLRASMRTHNKRLQEEVQRLTEALANSQRLLEVARKERRREMASPPPKRLAHKSISPSGSRPQLTEITKIASQRFLDMPTTPISNRTLAGPSIRTTVPVKGQLDRAGSVASVVVRSPSRAATPRASVRTVAPVQAPIERASSAASAILTSSPQLHQSPSAKRPAPPSPPSVASASLTPIAPLLPAAIPEPSPYEPVTPSLSVDDRGSLLSVTPFVDASRRTIVTTVKESGFQSQLAREVAGLEKRRDLEELGAPVEVASRPAVITTQPSLVKKASMLSFLSPPRPPSSMGASSPALSKPAMGLQLGRRASPGNISVPPSIIGTDIDEIASSRAGGLRLGSRRLTKDTEEGRRVIGQARGIRVAPANRSTPPTGGSSAAMSPTLTASSFELRRSEDHSSDKFERIERLETREIPTLTSSGRSAPIEHAQDNNCSTTAVSIDRPRSPSFISEIPSKIDSLLSVVDKRASNDKGLLCSGDLSAIIEFLDRQEDRTSSVHYNNTPGNND